MTETNLRKNYKLLAISEKKIEPVVAPAMDATPVSEPATEPPAEKVEEQPAESQGAQLAGAYSSGTVPLSPGRSSLLKPASNPEPNK